ncbi:MAG: methyltransferase domain-containing protein [Anaerolineae bacterium]|nr:methyltransferase domain-containing protein [Anaerolineae bacterium]
MPWNPDQYHKFQAARSAPFEDIAALITVREGLRAVDLGCGTGELTRKLADRLPGCDMLGIDNSPQMLTRAEAYAGEHVRFASGTVEDFAAAPDQWDLIFSHAALHWIPDHRALMPALFGKVRPGGQIAVQMPSNFNHIAQSLVVDIAREEPFRTALKGFARYSPVLPIDTYAELLFAAGFENIAVFEKIYPQVLENSDGVVEFTKGTVLVPYLERLESLGETFMQTYRERLRQHMPGSPVFYSFRRIIFVATQT